MSKKYKLTKSIFSLALLTLVPVPAYADEPLNVKCEYDGDLVSIINPTYWDYDYNIVSVRTTNTNIRLTKDEFLDLLYNSADEITINDGGSTINYNKKELIEKFTAAELTYNSDNEIIKKIVLNSSVTLMIIISTGLCIYSETKTKKLK